MWGFGFQKGFGPSPEVGNSGAATSNSALKGERLFGGGGGRWEGEGNVQVSVKFMTTNPFELKQKPNDMLRGFVCRKES